MNLLYNKSYLLFVYSLLFILTSCSQTEEMVENNPSDRDVIASPAPAPPVLIPTAIIHMDKTVSASGRNDMDVLRNYFYSGTIGNDNLTNNATQELWPVELNYAENIGVHGLRSINGERNSNLDPEGNFIPSNNLKTHLNTIHNHGWDLHLVVGQSKPKILEGNAWQWGPQQWKAYEDYAYKCLQFVMNEYRGGFQHSIIEISNEVDISGKTGYWFVEGTWNNGDLKAYAGLIRCYEQWAKAVVHFERDFPEKRISLFGPAVTVYTIWWTPMWSKENWVLKFIDDCRANSWRLDGISFHQYGAEMLGQRPDYSEGKNPKFSSTIGQIRDKLNNNGFSATQIWITEWGCSNWVGTERYKNNYRPVGGAFAAAFMHDALDHGVDGIVPLRLRDPNSSDDWSEIGSLATINKTIYPKPIYNVFKMFYQLPGERKKVEWKKPDVQLGAIASASQDRIGVIVYNYDWDDIKIVDRCLSHEVQVKVGTKNFTGPVKVKKFTVDSQHSNLARFVDIGQLPVIEESELQLVDEYEVIAANDTITLKSARMEASSVSFWVLSKDSK